MVSEERPPPGHYEPGAVRLLGALLKGSAGRAGSKRLADGCLRKEEARETAWDAGWSGILKIVSWSPASCSPRGQPRQALLFEPRRCSPGPEAPGDRARPSL